jgi:hypothetical protein
MAAAAPTPAVAAPTATQIAGTLTEVLQPSGKIARSKAILKVGGYTFGNYQALEPGSLAIDWYYLTSEVKGTQKPRTK